MSDSLAIPVIAGLAAGIVLIIVFSIVFLSPQLPENPLVPSNYNSSRVWVAINTTQCNQEPWNSQYTTVFEYFRQRGVLIYDSESSRWLEEDMLACTACGCPTGMTRYFQIDKSDVETMAQYGFVEKAPEFIYH